MINLDEVSKFAEYQFGNTYDKGTHAEVEIKVGKIATKRDILREALKIQEEMLEELEVSMNEDDIEVKVFFSYLSQRIQEKKD